MNMSITFSKKANIGSFFLLFCPTLSYLYLLLGIFAALTAATMSACHFSVNKPFIYIQSQPFHVIPNGTISAQTESLLVLQISSPEIEPLEFHLSDVKAQK